MAVDGAGNYLNADAAQGWLTRTKGLPDGAVAEIKYLQPYEKEREHSIPAKHYPLAVLSALQNPDKHRNLITVVTGLANACRSLDGGATWDIGHPDAVLKNRTRLHSAETPVKVKAKESPIVGVGTRNEARDLLWFLAALKNEVFGQVLPRLRPYL